MIGFSVWIVAREWGSGARPALILPLSAHVAATLCVALEIVSRAVKIQWGAAALSIPLSFSAAVRTCLGGDFAASLTPGRSGAEPARFLVLAEAKLPTPSILMVLFLELLMELTSLIVVALGLWFAFRHSGPVLGLIAGVVVGYAVFVLGVGASGLVLARRNASGPPPGWIRSVGLHAGHWRRVQRALRHVRDSVGALRGAKPGPLIAAYGASLVHIAAKIAILPAIVWGIGSAVELSALLVWPLILLYGGAIAPAPGGGGAVEFGFQQAFDGLMAPAILASALIWWRWYTLYFYILLGAFAGGTTVLRALRPSRGRPVPAREVASA